MTMLEQFWSPFCLEFSKEFPYEFYGDTDDLPIHSATIAPPHLDIITHPFCYNCPSHNHPTHLVTNGIHLE